MRHGIIIAVFKVAFIVVAVIICLLVGALSLNAHNDGLLVIAGLCALAAFGLTVLGALWILRSLRGLVKSTET